MDEAVTANHVLKIHAGATAFRNLGPSIESVLGDMESDEERMMWWSGFISAMTFCSHKTIGESGTEWVFGYVAMCLRGEAKPEELH